MRCQAGFTLIEDAFLAVIMAVTIALVMMVFGAPKRSTRSSGRPPQNYIQIHGIHTALVIDSQGNRGCYVGRNSDGTLANRADVATRFRTLIEDNYFTTEYAQCPQESPPPAGYSYDMVGLADTTGRRFDGWRDTTNSQAPMVSDRLTASVPGSPATYRGVYSSSPAGPWVGWVAYNDNHVNFESKAILPTNDGKNNHANDDLFAAESADDTLMVYSGT